MFPFWTLIDNELTKYVYQWDIVKKTESIEWNYKLILISPNELIQRLIWKLKSNKEVCEQNTVWAYMHACVCQPMNCKKFH